MTTTPAVTTPAFSLPFQTEKRFSSGDRIFIVTDTYTYRSSYLDFATEQQWYKVGAVDLATNRLGYFRFSIDDAKAIVRARVSPPPWVQPLPAGLELVRVAHKKGGAGRFPERVTLLDLEPEMIAIGPAARRRFDADAHHPNSVPGMWQAMVAAFALEQRIESAALSMVGTFSAGDIKDVVGGSANVTPVLQRLVKERRLVRSGRKRGAKYQVAPPLIPARVDWSG